MVRKIGSGIPNVLFVVVTIPLLNVKKIKLPNVLFAVVTIPILLKIHKSFRKVSGFRKEQK